jgi:hypothetical protein
MHDFDGAALRSADLELLFQEPQGPALQFERPHFLAEGQARGRLAVRGLHICVIADAYNGRGKGDQPPSSSRPAALTPEELLARKVQNRRQAKRALLIAGGLVLFAVLSGLYGREPTPPRSRPQPSASAEDDWTQGLRGLVVSAGKACTTAGEPFHQGTEEHGTNFWNIHCSDSGNYIISLKSGADPRVDSCANYRRVTGQECFSKIGAPVTR